MENKIFWLLFIALSLIAEVILPFVWSLVATIPIVIFSWWVAYRSGWLD